MTTSRLVIDIILLVMAGLLGAFVAKYASFSQWYHSQLGVSLMTQKVILLILCLLFPINSFLMRSDDGEWFKYVQIVLFGLFIIALAIDFAALYEAQRGRLARTVAWLRRIFHRR